MGIGLHEKNVYANPLNDVDKRKYKDKTGMEVLFGKVFGGSTDSNCTLIMSGPGTGKSTAFPAEAVRDGLAKHVLVVVPKRIVAITLVTQIEQYYSDTFRAGETVGALTGSDKIRVSESANHSITFCTSGYLQVLLTSSDPSTALSKWDTILIDEVHIIDTNNSINLWFLKKLKVEVPNKNYVLLSATVDETLFVEYLDLPRAAVVEIATQSHVIDEVKDFYPELSPAERIAKAVMEVVGEGDVICFTDTKSSSKALMDTVSNYLSDITNVTFHLLNAETDNSDIVCKRPSGIRSRVIFSTNVAETGVTLPELVLCCDTGKVLFVGYNPLLDRSVIFPDTVTQASMIQRRGRVGRVGAGKWLPLFDKDTEKAMREHALPSILVENFATALLTLKNVDESIQPTDLIKVPSLESSIAAMTTLHKLGFMKKNRLTTIGRLAGRFSRLNLRCRLAMIHTFGRKVDFFSAAFVMSLATRGWKKGLETIEDHVEEFKQIEDMCDPYWSSFVDILINTVQEIEFLTNTAVVFNLDDLQRAKECLILGYSPDRLFYKTRNGKWYCSGQNLVRSDPDTTPGVYIELSDTIFKGNEMSRKIKVDNYIEGLFY